MSDSSSRSSTPSSRVPQAGDVLGGYQLLAPIASGGMGQVWAARRTGKLGVSSLAAVKIALKDHAYQEDKLQALFYDEGRVAAIIDHPNVCKTYELGESDGALFLAMELIDGVSLLDLQKALPPPRRFAPAMAAYIVSRACAGLHAAHELKDDDGAPLNVVHRDATPHNVLVTGNGDVKVVDFGVAKARNQVHATVAGEFKGKINYIAPEQALSKPTLDRRADVFALGCVLYFMTTGERPFQGDSTARVLMRILEHHYDPPSSLMPDFPPALEAIVNKALAHDPADRFQTADEMRAALDDFARASPAPMGREELAALVRRLRGADLDARRADLRAAQRRLDGPTSGGYATASRSFSSLRPSAVTDAPVVLSMDGAASAEAGGATSSRGAPRRDRARLVRGFVAIAASASILGFVASARLGGAHDARTAAAAAPAASSAIAPASPLPSSVAQAPQADVVSLTVRATPGQAVASLDSGRPVATPHVFVVPRDDRPHTLQVSAPRYGAVAQAVTLDRSQTIELALRPIGADAPMRAPRAAPGRAPAPAARADAPASSDEPFAMPSKGVRPRRSIDEGDPF